MGYLKISHNKFIINLFENEYRNGSKSVLKSRNTYFD